MKSKEIEAFKLRYERYFDFQTTGDLAIDVKRYFLKFEKFDTYEHTLDVVNELNDMNEYFKQIEPGSRIACYCHDLGRVVKSSETLDFCSYCSIEVSAEEMTLPSILHQKISCFLAQKVFKISDTTILNAIKYHTTLRGNPSMTEIEVYLADTISWKEQAYIELSQRVKTALLESKEAAVYCYLSDMNDKRAEMKLYHVDSRDAYEWIKQLRS